MSTPSLNEKYYVFVIVDDFSRFTWFLFLTHKVMHSAPLTTFAKEWKTRVDIQLSKSEGLRWEFESENFNNFVLNMILSILFLSQEHPQ